MKICRDLPPFSNSSLWNSSSKTSTSLKKKTWNLLENFLWYSSLWNLSTMENSILPNSSTQKVIDPTYFQSNDRLQHSLQKCVIWLFLPKLKGRLLYQEKANGVQAYWLTYFRICWSLKKRSQCLSPKENKSSPRKQVQGDHEREEVAGPRGLKPKRSIKKEEKPTSRDWRRNSQDPQRPPRGADPPRRISKVKERLRQFERKRQKK